MQHTLNPITNERLSGLARVIRGNAIVALENVALWHERDISHSSAERIILPDSCVLLDYMLAKLRDVVKNCRSIRSEWRKISLSQMACISASRSCSRSHAQA